MKFKYFSFLFVLLLLLSACNVGVEPKEHLGEIYSVALESIMEQDEALHSDMEFIAIDMSNFKDVNESDKEEIQNHFEEKYKVDVLDATFEELKGMGLYDQDTLALDGVLLRIEKVDYKFNNSVLMGGSKFHSGTGAVGVEVEVQYKDEMWKAQDVKVTWQS